ncbi:MAG TPA: hypothetical protein DEP05_09200 [Betaproteobacteria bacterium]|nr:hypothetical protein [Betaproteobacteria bacterium]
MRRAMTPNKTPPHATLEPPHTASTKATEQYATNAAPEKADKTVRDPYKLCWAHTTALLTYIS